MRAGPSASAEPRVQDDAAMRFWTCANCSLGWATSSHMPDGYRPGCCPSCASLDLEEVIVAPVRRQLLVWGGLGEDLAGLDADLREALARVAPEGGALRGLATSATCRAAADAVVQDLAASDSPAANNLLHAVQKLVDAQRALRDARLHLTLARRALGWA